MKKILAFTIPVLMALTSCAQDVHQSLVPSIVLNTFQQKFPKAYDIEWEKKGEFYEVEFDLGFKDHKALIDTNGKMVKHKQDISSFDLPPAVKDKIAKNYPHYKIDDLDRIEVDGMVVYKVELENRVEEKKIYIKDNGDLLESPLPFEEIF